MATKYTLTNSYSNSKCVSNLLDTTNWASFLDTSTHYGQYAIGGPTLEMWCESWNTYLNKHPDASNVFTDIRPGTTDTYGYKVSSDKSQDQYWLYVNGTQTSISSTDLTRLQSNYSMYFPHTTEYSSCYGYWLASPSAGDGYDYRLMDVYCNGSVSNYDSYDYNLGLRPVVCLNSDVSATKEGNVWQLSK